MRKSSMAALAVGGALVLVLVLGATRGQTGDNEVAYGQFHCSSLATGEISASLSIEGSSGIVGAPAALDLALTRLTEANPASACDDVAQVVAGVARAGGCITSSVREIGFFRDFGFVCLGGRAQVIETIGQSGAALVQALP